MPNSAADPNLIPVDNPVLGMIDAAAERYGVDRNLAHVVAQMESNYNPHAVSGAGAQGVMQLMPATARGLGVTNSLDPAQNIDGGVKYLAQLSDRYGGDPRLVLAAYNAGPGAVDHAGGVPNYPETQNYVALGSRKLGSASRASDLSADPNLTPVEAAPAAPANPAPAVQPSVEVLPPLSEPPGPAKPPEKTFKGFLDNATMGLGRILEPLTDPAGTLENVTNLLQGMSEKSGFAPVMGQPRQQVIDGIVNLYKHRYGSIEGFKNAWYDDPVGMAGDVAMVFSGAGLGAKAAQDFLEASGITQHAASIADILPPAAAGTTETRVQAGIRGAVDALGKRYREVVQAGIEKAPSGVLGGPHGMLSTAKYGAAKKAGEILKEGWQKGTAAFDAPAAAPAAEAGTAAPAAAPATPDLATQQTELAAQGSMSPRVMPQSEAAQAFPEFYGQPAPAAEPGLTVADLGRDLTGGKSPSKLTVPERAAAQNLYSEVNPPVQVSPDVAPSTVAAPTTTAPPAAPQAAPVAPEAPAAAPTVPPATEAPIGPLAGKPQAAAIAQQIEEMTRPDRITGFLKANFADLTPEDVDKFDPHDWELIGKGAGGKAPTAEQITEVKANVANAAAPISPEVAKMPPAQAEAAVAAARKARVPKKPPATAPILPPGQTPAEALAQMMPESAVPPPEPGPAPPTAPEARVEAFAQHFAKDTEITPEAIASIAANPEAAGLLEQLGKSLGIKGRPAPGEIQKIADRVRELRRAGRKPR